MISNDPISIITKCRIDYIKSQLDVKSVFNDDPVWKCLYNAERYLNKGEAGLSNTRAADVMFKKRFKRASFKLQFPNLKDSYKIR